MAHTEPNDKLIKGRIHSRFYHLVAEGVIRLDEELKARLDKKRHPSRAAEILKLLKLGGTAEGGKQSKPTPAEGEGNNTNAEGENGPGGHAEEPTSESVLKTAAVVNKASTKLVPLRLRNEQRNRLLTKSILEFGLCRDLVVLGSCDVRHEVSHRLLYDPPADPFQAVARSTSIAVPRSVFMTVLLDGLQGGATPIQATTPFNIPRDILAPKAPLENGSGPCGDDYLHRYLDVKKVCKYVINAVSEEVQHFHPDATPAASSETLDDNGEQNPDQNPDHRVDQNPVAFIIRTSEEGDIAENTQLSKEGETTLSWVAKKKKAPHVVSLRRRTKTGKRQGPVLGSDANSALFPLGFLPQAPKSPMYIVPSFCGRTHWALHLCWDLESFIVDRCTWKNKSLPQLGYQLDIKGCGRANNQWKVAKCVIRPFAGLIFDEHAHLKT